MENFDFCNPTRILFGVGEIEKVGNEAMELGKRVLMVYGRGNMERTGLLDKIRKLLKEQGCKVAELGGIRPNPRIDEVQNGAVRAREHRADLVLGVGGGSVMDASKVIAAATKYAGNPWDMMFLAARPAQLPTEALPIMLIPTLAATGSEMNNTAVISRWESREKTYVRANCLYPTLSILDPALTVTVPPTYTAYGAADIIAHVTESYINGGDDRPLQDRIQEGIIQTVVENAPRAVKNGKDLKARTNLQWASVLALNGWAHAGGGGEFPQHAIEHVLSAHYDVAHGAGLSIIGPAWMRHVLPQRVSRLVQLGCRVFGLCTDSLLDRTVANAAVDCFEQFYRNVGTPVRLSELGVDVTKLERLAEDVIRISAAEDGRLPGRPPLSRDDVLAILEMAK